MSSHPVGSDEWAEEEVKKRATVGPIYHALDAWNREVPIAQMYYDVFRCLELKAMGRQISPQLEKIFDELERDDEKGGSEFVGLVRQEHQIVEDIETHGSQFARRVLAAVRGDFLQVIEAPLRSSRSGRAARALGKRESRRDISERKRAMYFGGL